MPFSAKVTASSKTGTRRAWSLAERLLAVSTSFRWPIRPKPVMSVAVLTPTSSMISPARLFSMAMDLVNASAVAALHFPS